MKTWWGVYDSEGSDLEPVAVFKEKELANKFNTEYNGAIRPCFFYETEEEYEFLEEAEPVWEN